MNTKEILQKQNARNTLSKKNKNKLLKICYNTKEFEKNIYISLETHKKKYNILVKKYKQTFTMNIKKSKLSVLTHKSYKKRNDTKHQK